VSREPAFRIASQSSKATMAPSQTILLIEDDVDITRLIERELISRHYRVEIAARGHHGLQMARLTALISSCWICCSPI
jgi:ActR/RegA family two-component response regulator